MTRMSKKLLLGLLAGGIAAPIWAAQGGYGAGYRPYTPPNELRFRLGLFEPRGDSQYWDEAERDFTGEPEDLEDLVGAIEYVRRLTGHLSLVASGTAYGSEDSLAYRDFVDQDGLDIVHDTRLDIATLTLGLRAILTGAEAPVQPWVGAGGGFYFWELEESGDFIAFVEPPFIFSDTFFDDGAVFGWYYAAGLDVPITPEVTLFGEARWDRADDELGGDFDELGELDLSGRQLSAGLGWRF